VFGAAGAGEAEGGAVGGHVPPPLETQAAGGSQLTSDALGADEAVEAVAAAAAAAGGGGVAAAAAGAVSGGPGVAGGVVSSLGGLDGSDSGDLGMGSELCIEHSQPPLLPLPRVGRLVRRTARVLLSCSLWPAAPTPRACGRWRAQPFKPQRRPLSAGPLSTSKARSVLAQCRAS
jgi:hypothetical protein